MILYESLNVDQKKAYELIEKSGRNILICASGGKGKSYLVNKIREDFGHETLFAAPTGIASLNITGMTLHSMLTLPFGYQVDPLWYKTLKTGKTAKAVFKKRKNIKRIVIDEISMIRADMFDYIDQRLRQLMVRPSKPFGGLQVILVGDLLQLEPVFNRKSSEAKYYVQEYKGIYCFQSHIWSKINPIHVHLHENMRTSDVLYQNILEDIRYGRNLESAVNYINDKCFHYGYTYDDSIPRICCTNAEVDEGNARIFRANQNPRVDYIGEVQGDFKEKDYPVPLKQSFKVGLNVMTLVNDSELGIRNGSTGVITKTGSEYITVKLDSGPYVDICIYEWKNYEYQSENNKEGISVLKQVQVGSYFNFPLRQCNYISVHKSQGVTLDRAVIDLSRCFANGQAYVALSRLTSLKGLCLARKVYTDMIKTSTVVLQFLHDNFEDEQAIVQEKPEPVVIEDIYQNAPPPMELPPVTAYDDNYPIPDEFIQDEFSIGADELPF